VNGGGGRTPRPVLLLTCEHAGRRVPPEHAGLFQGAEELLASHRGWDRGALALARVLEERLARWRSGPLVVNEWTRLLADVNRSPGHPQVHGEAVRALPWEAREAVLARYHRPHREGIRAQVADEVAAGRRVVHVGVHTFTPVYRGRVRPTDVGLLYDPARPQEAALAALWTTGLRAALPERRIHRNRPYRGVSDGLTTWLRSRFPPRAYAGLELEVNTRLLEGGEGVDGARGEAPDAQALGTVLAGTLAAVLEGVRG